MKCFLCGQSFLDGSVTSLAEHLVESHAWTKRFGCCCGQRFRKARTIEGHLLQWGITDADSYHKHGEDLRKLQGLVARVGGDGGAFVGNEAEIDGIYICVYAKRFRWCPPDGSSVSNPNMESKWISTSVSVDVSYFPEGKRGDMVIADTLDGAVINESFIVKHGTRNVIVNEIYSAMLRVKGKIVRRSIREL